MQALSKGAQIKSVIKSRLPKNILFLSQNIIFKTKMLLSKNDFNQKDYAKLNCLKCVIGYNRYGAYCVPNSSKHRFSAKRILLGRVHEPNTLSFIREHCEGSIVHAGTYFGDFLPALSSFIGKGASIYAYEPNAENYQCACITIGLNNLSNVKLVNCGLGAGDGVLMLQTADETGKPLGGASKITPDGKEQVIVNSIDQSVPDSEYISIIQLDVEGFEIEALKGAIKTVKRCRPILILEIWEGVDVTQDQWFNNEILGMGYIKTSVVDGNHVYAFPQ